VKASIEPQRDVGIRQVYAKEFRSRTPGNPHHPLDLDESAAAFEEEFRRWQNDPSGLVHFAIAIESNAHWVAAGMSTEELIARGHELARKLDLRITAHIAGGTFSIEKGFLRYLRESGRTDIRYLMQMGVLDSRWIIAHGIHCTDLDLDHMAQVGCSLVYTPTSESIRGGGIGPAARACRSGMNVALGTDGPMVDYSVDMVEQMKCCALLQHVRHLDPTLMPPERTIEMATINAARALGLDGRIGSLEPGKQADISVFDITKPYVGVLHRPISSFVCAGKGSDARVVLVDGRIVYRDGRFPRYADGDRAITEAQQIGRAILSKAGLEHRVKPEWRH
jgi:5-methylthioadenosine/S-adenosylhomocysteine deaminase